jgi:ABC-type Mn2+/Zn2+ transport system permease subunit
VLSILIALGATEGGILLSLAQPWPTSFFISAISFAVYVGARLKSR